MKSDSYFVNFVNLVNENSQGYLIHDLQNIRKDIKGFKRKPGSRIFSKQTIKDDWACHHGGRSELQFNIGYETYDEIKVIRYGIAFSLETSRSNPSLDELFSKIPIFNEFLELYPEEFQDFEMWHFQKNGRSENRFPSPISNDLLRNKTFIFLGMYKNINEVEVDDVLAVFDKLLPLYKFVESSGKISEYDEKPAPFSLESTTNFSGKSLQTVYFQGVYQKEYRHEEIQRKLCDLLEKEYGKKAVVKECHSGTGGKVDVVVDNNQEYIFYEIKVGVSIKYVIRQALGQLLEYCHWPSNQRAVNLVIVGEPELTNDANEYLKNLNEKYNIPVSYKQIALG